MLTRIYDVNPADYPAFPANPDIRRTARAVLLDAQGNMAVMYVGTEGYHKLPGGGLEEGEDHAEGFAREMQEETGCVAIMGQHVHTVEEYRAKGGFLQVSQAYLAKVVGEKGTPQFDAGERAKQFEVRWMPPQQALALLEQEYTPHDYTRHFINMRERAILTAALAQLETVQP